MFDSIELWFQQDWVRFLMIMLGVTFFGGYVGSRIDRVIHMHEDLKREVGELKSEVEDLKWKTRHVD